MSQRLIRINELIKREISLIIRQDYQAEMIYVTIIAVHVTSNLRNADVQYTVLGDTKTIRKAGSFFKKNASTIRYRLNQRIILKFSPILKFVFDTTAKDTIAFINRMDRIEYEDNKIIKK